MEADGGRWGGAALLALLVALLAMLWVLMPAADTARTQLTEPVTVEYAEAADLGMIAPESVSATAIGDHQHEWSTSIQLLRWGADAR